MYAFTFEEIKQAYKDCLKNKATTASAIEYTDNMMINLTKLYYEVNRKTYDIGVSTAFIITRPVLREVFAADFRDRIVHHLVMNELMPYFEKEFIDESFSCREGKGVLHGVDTIERYIKECTCNYTKDAWIMKLDLKSFFMSIEKERLAKSIDDFIVKDYPESRKKERLRELCRQIIMHHPEENCERHGNLELWKYLEPSKSLFNVGKDHGLPIGNLTSQIFANYFLTPLDKFIKHRLGFTYYGRYVDDFVIISRDRRKLLQSVKLIEEFAWENLHVRIHKKKRYFQHYTKGVRFIGGVIKPHRKYILNRTIGTLISKLRTKYREPKEELLDEFINVMNSYLGFMRHYNEYNMRKKLLTENPTVLRWKPYIYTSENYERIQSKRTRKRLKRKLRRLKKLPYADCERIQQRIRWIEQKLRK